MSLQSNTRLGLHTHERICMKSFAQSSHYRDDIRGRLVAWEEQTGIRANQLELFVNADQLLSITKFDDGWPDPRHPESVDQRVLAAFVDLSGWRFLTGDLIFVTPIQGPYLDLLEHSGKCVPRLGWRRRRILQPK